MEDCRAAQRVDSFTLVYQCLTLVYQSELLKWWGCKYTEKLHILHKTKSSDTTTQAPCVCPKHKNKPKRKTKCPAFLSVSPTFSSVRNKLPKCIKFDSRQTRPQSVHSVLQHWKNCPSSLIQWSMNCTTTTTKLLLWHRSANQTAQLRQPSCCSDTVLPTKLHNYDNQAVALTPFCQPNCKTMTTKLLLWHRSVNQTARPWQPSSCYDTVLPTKLQDHDNQALAMTPFCQPNCKTMTTKLLLWHHSANQSEKKTHSLAVLSRQEGHTDWCLCICRLDQPSTKVTSQHSSCLHTLLLWCLSAAFLWHGFAFRISFTYSKCSHITIPYPSPCEFYLLEYSKLHKLD